MVYTMIRGARVRRVTSVIVLPQQEEGRKGEMRYYVTRMKGGWVGTSSARCWWDHLVILSWRRVGHGKEEEDFVISLVIISKLNIIYQIILMIKVSVSSSCAF